MESLRQSVAALRRGETPPNSPYRNSTGTPQGPLLNEPTEMEVSTVFSVDSTNNNDQENNRSNDNVSG